MKSLIESLFDDDILDQDNIDKLILNWIKQNVYTSLLGNFKIENVGGKYIVNANGAVKMRQDATSLNCDGMFEWGFIKNFDCSYCTNLKSLKGAPKEVGDFICGNNINLKTLEGAPKHVRGVFSCAGCSSLKSLKGISKTIKSNIMLSRCEKLESLKGLNGTVFGDLTMEDCPLVKDFKDGPDVITGSLNCNRCQKLKLDGLKHVGGILYARFSTEIRKQLRGEGYEEWQDKLGFKHTAFGFEY